MYFLSFFILFRLIKSTENSDHQSSLLQDKQNLNNAAAIFDDSSSSDPNPTPTATPTTPISNTPPSPLTVWITSIIGVAIIGATVLYLCIKKQPDDMLFDTPKSHLQTMTSLNTLNNLTSADNVTAPLVFLPEGSLN